MFDLFDTPEKWQAIWDSLTSEEISLALSQGKIQLVPQAEAHPRSTGTIYTGDASMTLVYMFQGVQVSTPKPYLMTEQMPPDLVKDIADMVIERIPSFKAALASIGITQIKEPTNLPG